MKAFGLFIEMKQKKKNLEKKAFFVFLGCFWAYIRQPQDHIGWATPIFFASINPTNPNFHEKILRISGAGKGGFLSWPFWILFFKKKKNLLHIYENMQPAHMRYHLFLHYGWFLQNLGKNFIRSNMHTTVCT
jgi:hypothetical protein